MIDVVWFKRDLRVHDHAPLVAAAASGRPVIALYILEPMLWRQPEMAGRHFDFLRECLGDLDAALRQRGTRLTIRVGEAVAVLADLHAQHSISTLYAHEETGLLWTYARDRAVRRWAKGAGVVMQEHRQFGVWRGPVSRDGWAKRWDQMMCAPTLPAPGAMRCAGLQSDPMPDAQALGLAPDLCALRQPGGRAEAARLLKSFLADRGRFYRAAMASPNEGAEACSRVSAHLAFGCISMRETFQAAVRAQRRWRDVKDDAFSQSIASFVSRLHWHCHFMQKLESEPEIEKRTLHPAYEGLRPPREGDEALVDAWAQGRTGFPFVDACMRSLTETGWLNFRMRSMVMAFASYHLWLDWRAPALRLARLFTDFEPGIHYPQAQMQSGVTGVNIARIYNPVKQSRDQDPDAVFIRRWVPEVAALPTAFIHEPWVAPPNLLHERGVRLGETYPSPLVDHVAAAAHARDAIYAVRKGQDFRAAAGAIQAKHGSRRSGLAPTYRRTRPTKAPGQTEFEF